MWLGSKILERLLGQVSDVISEVAAATGTAIGQGVQVAYTPPPEPEYIGADHEGEALEFRAYDPTYNLLPDVADENRIVGLAPGESLIPRPVD